jgi:hypothetical protein
MVYMKMHANVRGQLHTTSDARTETKGATGLLLAFLAFLFGFSFGLIGSVVVAGKG